MLWQGIGTSEAERYERHQVPITFARWAEELVGTVNIRDGMSVLDVACGTGIMARTIGPLLGARGRVVGLDSNPAMLALARSLAPAVDFHEASADAMPFPDESFDAVLCQYGLMFFPDRPRALAEMRRVLRPQGQLALSIWGAIEDNPDRVKAGNVLSRFLPQEESSKVIATFGRIFGTATAEELGSLIESVGFRDVNARVLAKTWKYADPTSYVVNLLSGSAATQTIMSQLDDGTRAQVVDAMLEELRQYIDTDGLSLPSAAIVASARK